MDLLGDELYFHSRVVALHLSLREGGDSVWSCRPNHPISQAESRSRAVENCHIRCLISGPFCYISSSNGVYDGGDDGFFYGRVLGDVFCPGGDCWHWRILVFLRLLNCSV